MNVYLGNNVDMSWAAASRIFASTIELLGSQPNYEHEIALALDTGIKYQGIAPIVGGWGYASDPSQPGLPFAPAPVNDGFTKVLLEFDGIEGSTTYLDTNGAGIARKWTQQSGFGCITNVGEKFYSGALILEGNTVVTTPDDDSLDLGVQNFTIRGWFLCAFPLGAQRTLIAKTDQIVDKRVFWIERTGSGFLTAGVGLVGIANSLILDRTSTQIVDRLGGTVLTRFAFGITGELQSDDVYSSTVNVGWHEFKFTRAGTLLSLLIDGVLQESEDIGAQTVNRTLGTLTIGGYGPLASQSNPWIGGLDRFAIDVGIAR
jgi:hypothetical protein